MLESYIRTGDGTDYVEVDNVREALGIKEDENIFRAIEKLREERDNLKDNLRITENALKTVKKERDELKDKCDKLKTRTNAAYGASCGYSSDKAPAFLCNVISYRWEPGYFCYSGTTLNDGGHISVELDLTPNANYEWIFDPEDLRQYIQNYGREKKLGIVESVDYQNAKAARAELAHLYKTVLGKEKLDRDLSPHEVMKAINEEYKRVVHNFEERTEDWSKAQQELDRYARFRSNVCTALCLGGETSDADILKRVRMTKECHDALCKDYTELRKAIWDAMDRKPETLPEETARLVGEVTELARGEKLLIEFRDDVAKAIGMDYPTTNNAILHNVRYIYKDRSDAYGIVTSLNDHVTELEKAKEDLQQKFEFQSDLRRTWHARYESEHERANCVQKALDREREKCRVKDISLETAKKQYEKVCNNLETAECALNGMRNKVRSLQEEKTKVISAIGQDIWDACLK